VACRRRICRSRSPVCGLRAGVGTYDFIHVSSIYSPSFDVICYTIAAHMQGSHMASIAVTKHCSRCAERTRDTSVPYSPNLHLDQPVYFSDCQNTSMEQSVNTSVDLPYEFRLWRDTNMLVWSPSILRADPGKVFESIETGIAVKVCAETRRHNSVVVDEEAYNEMLCRLRYAHSASLQLCV
jgi:hypothetical protein